jgi:succinoglycan biosynthesis transport protein ExoP
MTRISQGFTQTQDIEQVLGLPVLCSISRQDRRESNDPRKPRDIIPNLSSRVSDALLSLRRDIKMIAPNNPENIIQLTSTVSGEGKSTISHAIAASTASSGLNVLLIDASIRSGKLSQGLGVTGAPGLVEALLGTSTLQAVIRPSADGKFRILPAGGNTDNPIDLLSSARFRSIFTSLKNSFDYIVVDSPPVGLVIDPVIISGFTDKVIYVIKWETTPREAVAHALKHLSLYSRPVGITLNQIPS